MPNVSLRLRLLFVGILLLLIAGTVLTFVVGRLAIVRNHQTIRTEAVIESLTRTLSGLQDAETGQRGYLLTGLDSYLAHYEAGVAASQKDLQLLKDSADAGALDAGQVAELQRLADQKFAALRQAVDVRRRQGFDAALQIVRDGVGKEEMDQFRSVLSGLVSGQQIQLDKLRRESMNASILRTSVFAVVAVVEVLFCLWCYRRILAEMERNRLAGVEMQRQKDLLSVTLKSIGDAVMVADPESRITFMNPVAESLTGWSLTEARGHPASEIFRIVNESTREPVESPIEKVFRLGVVVGLANHTVLIRKDGTEIPIDDSGAPIRDENANTYGAVLVFRDFSQHKAAEQDLLAAKAEAERAGREKDQFLAALSHELRTPLTPVIATLQMWEMSDEVPRAIKADIIMLRRNVDLEARLIDDLLDLTRIARGKLSLNPETFDLHDLLRAVLDILRAEIEDKSIRLTARLAAAEHFMHGDTARVQQVMWNILRNAVKFTGNGGTILVETENPEPGRVTLRVTDSGIGMAPETLARVFQPFAQADTQTTQRYGGLGLGLSIAKALTDAHGGSIDACSDGADKGSTFTVRFPTSPEPRPLDEPTAAGKSQSAGRSLRILLVEDHSDTARAMERILASFGHQIKTASSVQSALSLAQQDAFDLLMSDIGLPDGSGLELVKQVRSLQEIPAIALTGYGMEDDVARCRAAGFAAHLTKPVNFHKLHATIENIAVRQA